MKKYTPTSTYNVLFMLEQWGILRDQIHIHWTAVLAMQNSSLISYIFIEEIALIQVDAPAIILLWYRSTLNNENT